MTHHTYRPPPAGGSLGNMPAIVSQIEHTETVARGLIECDEAPAARLRLWRASAALRLALHLFAHDPLLFGALCAQVDQDRGQQ